MSVELATFYQEATASAVAEWIHRSIVAYVKANAGAEPHRLSIWPIAGTYPSADNPQDQSLNLGPRQSIAIAFTLGYCSGLLNDPGMAHTYEALYRTLESMHFHYKLQYGVIAGVGELPVFVVRTPGDPSRHLAVKILSAVEQPSVEWNALAEHPTIT